MLQALHVVLHTALPAERPWPRRPAVTGTAEPHLPPGSALPQRHGTFGPVNEPINTSAPGGGRRRGGRGASRRRGSRGGVNWRRHGDIEPNQLIIGHLNIQSYKPKIPDLRNDINGVYGYDILALCETWLTPRVPDRLMGVNGYKLYRRDRPTDLDLPKGKGGVALLVRDNLTSELLPTPVTGIVNSNLEIMWVLVRTSKHQAVLVASAYRVPHNTTRQLATDLEDLECQLQHMLTNFPRATLILGGDLNCCLLKSKNSDAPNPLLRLCATYELHVTNKTRPTYRPAGSLLDVILTNRPELLRRVGITRCHYGGPHDFTRVILARESSAPPPRQSNVYRRAISRIDNDVFSQQLSDTDWTRVYCSVSPDQKWLSFKQIFLAQLDTVAPLKRTRVRTRTSQPLTYETQQLLQRRRAALTANDRAEYKRINRLSRAAIRSDCRALYQREIERGDRGSLWRVLQPIIGRKKQQCQTPNVTPDALNDYYVSVGPTTAASVPAPSAPVPTRLPRVTTSSFKVQPINLDSLYSTLLSMKSSSSVGDDGISVAMFQTFFFGLAYPLLDVVNASLVTGLVPAQWKHALVTPIPKGKVSSKPADTRPISILPAIMKLVEKVVQNQLNEYLETNKLLSSAQHGYRKKHSTETALHVITDKVLHAMDNGQISLLVLQDLSKCFDVVPHQKLLDKLTLYGVDTDWFENYLTGHTQQVQIRGADGGSIRSRTKPNTIGVYQGGALSCILYMLFANDLSQCVPDEVTVVQFADDTQVLVSGKKQDLQQLTDRMEAALCSLYQWFCHNGVKLNATKTQMLVLGTPAMLRELPPVTLSFCGTVIPDSRQVKNLGLTIDRHLNYQSHIDTMTNKCTGILIALSHARHVIPKSSLKIIVQALVMSIVRYCISVYGSCGTVQLHRVQKVINFCARVVTGRRRFDHIADAIQQFGWLTAKQLVDYHTVSSVQTAIVTGQPENINDTILPRANEQHHHNTRGCDQFKMPRMVTETGKRRLCSRGVATLNELRLDPSAPAFRTKLRRRILSSEPRPNCD